MKNFLRIFFLLVFLSISVFGQANLSSPVNGSTWETTTPTLCWWMIGGTSTTVYTVQVSTDQAFSSYVVNATVSGAISYTIPTPLQIGTRYYWRIIYNGVPSSIWNFTTTGVTSGAPNLSAPVNGSTWETLSPTLTWWLVGSTQFTSYQVQVSTNSSFDANVINTTITGITSYTIPIQLSAGTVYYWRIICNGASSDIWHFTPHGTTSGSGPVLSSPVNNATGVSTTPTLSWWMTGETISTVYGIQVSLNSSFTNLIVNTTVTGANFYTLSSALISGTQYFWRVSYNGSNSEVWNFTTQGTSPGNSTPVLSSPIHNATGVSINPTLYWWMTGGTSSSVYGVQISLSSDFTNIIVNTTVTGTTSYTVSSPLPAGTQYYWRVSCGGYNSEVWRFTTTGTQTGVGIPHLLTPLHSATVSTTPTLNWWMIGGTSSSVYNVQVSLNSGFTTTVINTTVTGLTSYTIPSPLYTGIQYFWRITCNSVNSEVWNFTTEGAAVIPQFSQLGIQKSPSLTSQVWTDLSGNLINGFTMELLPNSADPQHFYYLNTTQSTATNITLANGYYGFTLASHPSGFDAYWLAKGVYSGCPGTWEPTAYQIISGSAPTFYLRSDGGSLSLVDGVSHFLNSSDNSLLRINDDYPVGAYTYTGTIIGANGVSSGLITVTMTITRNTPVITALTLKKSPNGTGLWEVIGGNLATGFSMEITPKNNQNDPYYYLDVNTVTTNMQLAAGTYGFNITDHPTGFDQYWTNNGVTSQSGLIYNIITGAKPTFYLKVDGAGNISLLDGYLFQNSNPPTEALLRINDDYPTGTYKYEGTITGTNGVVSNVITVTMEITRTKPQFTALVLQKSPNGTDNWLPLNGNLANGFSMELLPNAGNYYYLNVVPAPSTTTNIPLATGTYGFKINSHPDNFLTYWADKGVVANQSGDIALLFNIISGDAPTFYLKVDDLGDLSLIDGFLYQKNSTESLLRINDDYPVGSYRYEGTITGSNGVVSDVIIVLMVISKEDPEFTTLGLQKSPNGVDSWETIGGDQQDGFAMQLAPNYSDPQHFYYLNVTPATATNITLADGYYGFKLTSYPEEGFEEYWDEKGVNAGAQSGWQAVAYNIISRGAPTFYLRSNAGALSLVDGLLHQISNPQDPQSGYNALLRINDDYPYGTYTYEGTIVSANGSSSTISISLTISGDGTKELNIASNANAVSGSTITLPVYLYLSGEPISSIIMGKFHYDNTKLHFNSAAAGVGTVLNNNTWSLSTFNPGVDEIGIIASGIEDINNSGVLLNLTFNVIGATAGSTEITGTTTEWNIDGSTNVISEINTGTVTYTVGGSSALRGDATLDYLVDIFDAIAVLNHVNLVTSLTDEQALINADADLSDVIDINDALAIINFVSTGSWPVPAPSQPVNTQLMTGIPKFIQDRIFELPLSVSSHENVNTIDIEFTYNPDLIEYYSFKSLAGSSKNFINSCEVKPGVAKFTILSNGLNADSLSKIYFKLNENSSEFKITTSYSVNGQSYKPGNTIEYGVTGTNEIVSKIPTNYSLNQNFPNPFNPSTRINYELPEAGEVIIKVFDVLGKEIALLVDEYKSAGTYSISFDGAGLPSGIYYYTIMVNEFNSVRKMILLK